MAWPTLTLRVAFASDPMDATPVWTTITGDVRRIRIRRGRNHELDRMEAGTMMLELKNFHGNYWPLNAGSIHSPNVLPAKRVDFSATYNAVDYPLYTGFIEDWNPDWLEETGGLLPIVNPDCVDLINNLSNYDINGGWTLPTGFVDPGVTWNNEANAYDNDLITRADTFVGMGAWSNFLELTHAGVNCNGIRVYCSPGIGMGVLDLIDLDAEYDGIWNHVYQGTFALWEWILKPLVDGTKTVTSIRVRFHESGVGVQQVILYELHLHDSTAGYFQRLSGARIGVVLDDLGWPPGARDLDAGQSQMQATGALVDANSMEHLFLVQKSELGIVYIAGDGDVQFEDRHHRLKAPHTISQATFGDDVGENYYHGMEPRYGSEEIRNDIRITRSGGVQQSASDATSQTDYGKRSLSRTGLLMTTDNEADDQAEYMLKRYKDPAMRNRLLKIIAERDPGRLWPQVLGREISDRITVRRNEASIDNDYHIEGVQHDIDLVDRTWTTYWQLSDADSQVYWMLGIALFSELDQTTWLGY